MKLDKLTPKGRGKKSYYVVFNTLKAMGLFGKVTQTTVFNIQILKTMGTKKKTTRLVRNIF